MDWTTLAYAFGLVFISELGDKTQLAVIAQTCKYRRPGAVFLGATLALAGVTALGVIGGQLLGHIVPRSVLRAAASLAFVVMGGLVGREAVRASRHDAREAVCEYVEEVQLEWVPAWAWDWKAFSSTLGLLFVAEMGDKTQLAVMGLAQEHGAGGEVFLGGTLALAAVTAVGVISGQGLSRLVPRRLLLGISAGTFIAIGAFMGLAIL